MGGFKQKTKSYDVRFNLNNNYIFTKCKLITVNEAYS